MVYQEFEPRYSAAEFMYILPYKLAASPRQLFYLIRRPSPLEKRM
jgi:hypothetical protein